MWTVETKRLKLIPFSLDLKKALIHDRGIFAEMLGVRVPEHWPEPDLVEDLPFLVQDMERNQSGAVLDGVIIHKADGVLIGEMEFFQRPDEEGVLEIDYSIIPDYRNHGYATEMARSFIAWAFQEKCIKVVTARCLDDSIESIKVLEKLGMHRLEPEGHVLKWEMCKQE